MPTKKHDVVAEEPQASTVLYDELFELKDGRKLRLVVDLATVLNKVRQYTQDLQDVRGIPFDTENLAGRDPIIRYLLNVYAEQIKSREMDDAAILNMARNYYRRAMAEAENNAYLLSFFDLPENEFPNPPTPYEKDEQKTNSRFATPMPEIEKNLAFPVERFLKQILDTMIENPAVLARVTQIAEQFSVRVNRLLSGGIVETDEHGFHAGAVNS